MSKVADMRARALDDLLVGFDQSISFAREWRNLFWEFSTQAFGTPRPDCSKPVGDAFERCQSETDLKSRREQQDGRKYGKCYNQRLIERSRFFGDFGSIAGYSNEIVTFIAKIDIALD